jgi:hypothetical protein
MRYLSDFSETDLAVDIRAPEILKKETDMSELTYEIKREFARRLRTLPDEEKVAVLDILAESGWGGVVVGCLKTPFLG